MDWESPYFRGVSDSLYLAALAVVALDGLEVVSTRPPLVRTDDFISGGVLDSQGRKWVIRCPRNSEAATMIEAEAAVAPFLLDQLRSGKLPFDIIRPAGFAQSKGGRAVVYPEPFGHATSWELLTLDQAHEVGRMLASVHQLPHSVIHDAGLPVYSVEEWRGRIGTEIENLHSLRPLPPLLKRRWFGILDDDIWTFSPAVIHGDVDMENLLWSDTGIATVVGFGESKVADPAVDLSPFLSLEDDLYRAVVSSYEKSSGLSIDEAMYSRMLFMSEFAIARWLLHGIRTQNSHIEQEATAMLDDLLRQLQDDPEAGGPHWDVVPSE